MGTGRRARRAAAAAGLLLGALYAATAARDPTFWDAGEFVAAFATLGIPHPPGTPLFTVVGRAWTLVLGGAGVGVAHAAALLSAACTAGAGAVTAWLVARWTRSAVMGIGAALAAGAMSTAWASATEAEVYAPSLLLSLLAVAAGDVAGRATAGPARGPRATLATAYALSLSVALHLSALVAAPAAILLACDRRLRGRGDLPHAARSHAAVAGAALAGVTLLCAGVGSGRAWLAGAGVLVAVAALVTARGGYRSRTSLPLGALGVAVIGLTAVLVLLVRARHDPWLNQADPSSWPALADVVARRQYAPAPPWPRQAPWWIQVGNLFEWADWQVAYGLAPAAPPALPRTALTVLAAGAAFIGARWHRRRDARSWRAWAVLLASGTLGVAAYLNLKAGPSYGVGVLPDDAPHEARERDYFFVLGWWAWGAWTGIGCAVVARWAIARGRRRFAAPRAALRAGVALAAAAAPALWNWGVRDRGDSASESAGVFARAVLRACPPGAVLLVAADNDSYPLWAVQAAEGTRRDVTPVTVSLLGAPWYRAELARRHALVPRRLVARWEGEGETVASIVRSAEQGGRVVVATLGALPAARRATAGWAHGGLIALRTASAAHPREAVLAPAWVGERTGLPHIHPVALVRSAAAVQRAAAGRDVDPERAVDGIDRWARRQLACPAALAAALRAPQRPSGNGAARLETLCQGR